VSSKAPTTASLSSIALTLTAIGAAVVHTLWGYSVLLLFLAAAVLCLCIVLMWASLQQMGQGEEMTFEEALSFAAPSATEEQKRALLRTLKDLEYELHVGKISREDFDEVSREVRRKAKLLIAQQDEDIEGGKVKAEARVEEFKKASKKQEVSDDVARGGSEADQQDGKQEEVR
jgi:triphosphoribosyl-dephospho-CoA synthetase